MTKETIKIGDMYQSTDGELIIIVSIVAVKFAFFDWTYYNIFGFKPPVTVSYSSTYMQNRVMNDYCIKSRSYWTKVN